jgi:hypothetical protein
VGLLIDVAFDPSGVKVEVELVAAAVVGGPAFGGRDAVVEGPQRMIIGPPGLFEEGAHEPFFGGDTAFTEDGAAFGGASAEEAGLGAVGFGEFVADVVGPTDFGMFSGGIAPGAVEVVDPGIGVEGAGRGREPDADVVGVRVEERHEGAHAVVAFAFGVDGRRELQSVVGDIGHAVVVIVEVEGGGDADLAEVRETGSAEGEVARAGKSGEEETGEDGDDADGDEQFNERESTVGADPWQSWAAVSHGRTISRRTDDFQIGVAGNWRAPGD